MGVSEARRKGRVFIDECLRGVERGIILREFRVGRVRFDALLVESERREVIEGEAAQAFDLTGKDVYVLEFVKGGGLRHLKECFGEIIKIPYLIEAFQGKVRVKGFYCILEDVRDEYKRLVEESIEVALKPSRSPLEVKVLTPKELAETLSRQFG